MSSTSSEDANDIPIEDIDQTTKKPIEGADDDVAADWSDYPIDSVLIRTEPRTVFEVTRRINADQYVMDPDFQRDFIWSDKKQSGLIESCLMRIPLPVFYLAEQTDGRVVVVDGLQRLTTFQRFLNDELTLRLKGRPGLNGKKFSTLSPNLRNRVEDTNLVFYLIDSKVPERAKLDIFERVNSGVPLTRQQMRNCIHVGPATRWLKNASRGSEFIRATGGSLNQKSMRDREVITRFCGFTLLGRSRYRGDMDEFLAETMRYMNTLDADALIQLHSSLARAMENNYAVFGKHAFRKHTDDSEYRNPINIALFDVYSTLMARYEPSLVSARGHDIRQAFYELMDEQAFIDSISLGTNQVDRVAARFSRVEKQLAEILPDD